VILGSPSHVIIHPAWIERLGFGDIRRTLEPIGFEVALGQLSDGSYRAYAQPLPVFPLNPLDDALAVLGGRASRLGLT
jgi:hypothetical protein